MNNEICTAYFSHSLVCVRIKGACIPPWGSQAWAIAQSAENQWLRPKERKQPFATQCLAAQTQPSYSTAERCTAKMYAIIGSMLHLY